MLNTKVDTVNLNQRRVGYFKNNKNNEKYQLIHYKH